MSLALLLLQQGVRPLLVERRSEVSWYPRARNLNFRTMEVFRGLGLADEVHAKGARVSRIFQRERLASTDQKEVMDPASMLDTRAFSPEPFLWYCPQSRLEPVLLDRARKGGADVRYETELVSFTQDDDGVSATLKDHTSGQQRTARAEYLVGADGAHSSVREALGVGVEGQGTLDEHYVFIYLRAAWDELVRGYESDAFLVDNPDVRGMFVVAEKDLAMFILTLRPDQGESAEAFTRERARDLAEKAIGKPGFAMELVEVAPWRPEQRVAERFQQGRAFLLGDAAHTMPPAEGLGVNTAIQSAQNLGWKLAAVLQGRAAPRLLSTYEAERRPVAWFAAQHSMTGPAAALLQKVPEEEKASEFFPIVGYRYRSEAVVSEDGEAPPPGGLVLVDRQELTGVPGTRVPHLWLERNRQRISTLDLLDGRFVLLTGAGGNAWSEAAAAVAEQLGVEVAAFRIGSDGDLLDLDNGWLTKMGGASEGAVLVRPDGFVAWRTSTGAPSPGPRLVQVLSSILCRSTSRPACKRTEPATARSTEQPEMR